MGTLGRLMEEILQQTKELEEMTADLKKPWAGML